MNCGRRSVCIRVCALLLIAAVSLLVFACGSSTGPTKPSGTVDEQRYHLLRGMIRSILTECCKSADRAFSEHKNLDFSSTPGAEWPVAIPSSVPDYVRLIQGKYYLSAAYLDDSLSVAYNWQITATDTTVEDQVSHYWEVLPRSMDARWSLAVYTKLSGLGGDTMDVEIRYAAHQSIADQCYGKTCQAYGLTIGAQLEQGPYGFPLVPLSGGQISARLIETETSSHFGSDLQITWNIEGTFLSDGRMELDVVCGLFSVRDTLVLFR